MSVKWIAVGIVVVAVIGGGLFLGLQGASSQPAEAAASAPAVAVETTGEVIAEAKVVPVQYADLSVSTPGMVTQVLVEEGEVVEAGQMLLSLGAAHQAAAVAGAEAELRRAQAQLDELMAGPRPQEVTLAKSSVQSAQARLDQITEGPGAEEVQAAQAALSAADASMRRILEGLDENEATVAAAAVRQSEIALQQAQWAYDQVAYGTDAGASLEAAALEQATLTYEAAAANYRLAVEGSKEDQVAVAQYELAQAQASLAVLIAGPSQAAIAGAHAEIQRAQAQLELVEAGARVESIASAEAAVAAAEAAVLQAQASLLETEVRALFPGVVATLGVDRGEYVMPGTVVVQLADTTGWKLETDDLTELNIAGIGVGDPARIIIDAIPGLEMTGRVIKVRSVGEDKHGDVTYTVSIVPDFPDPRLRWNMTAAVFIAPVAGTAQATRPDSDQLD